MKGCSEDVLQKGAARFLDGLIGRGYQFAWHHPANGGLRSKAVAGRMKASGVKAGQPDIEIFKKHGQTFFIEIKAIEGSLSPAQKDRHGILTALGYRVYVIKSSSVNGLISQLSNILSREGLIPTDHIPTGAADGYRDGAMVNEMLQIVGQK